MEADSGPAPRRFAPAADRDRAPGRLSGSAWRSSPKASCSRWSRILRFSSVLLLVVGRRTRPAPCVAGAIGIAHANGQLAQLVPVAGQQVRLQVEHDLQPMLDLAQEARSSLPGSIRSWCVRQPPCSSWAIASSVLPVRTAGRSPPLSSCRNWMTNSMSRMPPWPVLTLRRSAPSLLRALLDAPLEGLDAGDVGQAQIAAIDPRLELLRETRWPSSRSPATGRALTNACRSQVRPEHVVIVQRRFEAGDHRARVALRAAAAGRRDRPRPSRSVSVSSLTHVARQPIEELAVGLLPRAVGLAVRRRTERSGRCRWNSSARCRPACPGQHDEPGRLAVGPRAARRACASSCRAGEPQRPLRRSRRPDRKSAAVTVSSGWPRMMSP